MYPELQPYTRRKPTPAPKLRVYHGITDEAAPPKHTAKLIDERLKKEHCYPGGYDQVRRYMSAHRRIRRETFLPLDDSPGQRIEADFRHIHVDFPEGRRLVPVLLLKWSHSYCPFALALPTERVEAMRGPAKLQPLKTHARATCCKRSGCWLLPIASVTSGLNSSFAAGIQL